MVGSDEGGTKEAEAEAGSIAVKLPAAFAGQPEDAERFAAAALGLAALLARSGHRDLVACVLPQEILRRVSYVLLEAGAHEGEQGEEAAVGAGLLLLRAFPGMDRADWYSCLAVAAIAAKTAGSLGLDVTLHIEAEAFELRWMGGRRRHGRAEIAAALRPDESGRTACWRLLGQRLGEEAAAAAKAEG